MKLNATAHDELSNLLGGALGQGSDFESVSGPTSQNPSALRCDNPFHNGETLHLISALVCIVGGRKKSQAFR